MGNRLLATGDKIEFHDSISKADLEIGIKPKVYVSQIFDFTDEGNINVAMPISKGKLVPLERGRTYDTYFYTSKGIYQCRAKIISRNKNDNLYSLEIMLTTELQKFQRRQYFRLEKTLPIYYAELTEEDYLLILETRQFPDGMKNINLFSQANTLDISGGGMRFVGKTLIEENKKILVMFDIDEHGKSVKYRLPATVIKSFVIRGKVGTYEHRIEFENITKEYRELLIRYIFEEERKKRRVDLL